MNLPKASETWESNVDKPSLTPVAAELPVSRGARYGAAAVLVGIGVALGAAASLPLSAWALRTHHWPGAVPTTVATESAPTPLCALASPSANGVAPQAAAAANAHEDEAVRPATAAAQAVTCPPKGKAATSRSGWRGKWRKTKKHHADSAVASSTAPEASAPPAPTISVEDQAAIELSNALK